MLQSGQFNLKLALPALGPLREDVQNQRGAVEHCDAELTLQIALLHRRQRRVQDDNAGTRPKQLTADFLDLAAPQIQRRIGAVASHHELPGGQEASAFGQLPKLLDVVRSLERASALAAQRNFDQQRRRRRFGSRPLDLESAQDSGSVVRLTGRAGTTVDIACLYTICVTVLRSRTTY